ncbi:MAG: hypothetical protein ABEJ28_02020 [Salinigranum sp.]
MPATPHYPSEDPERDRRAPDFGDILDRILNGGNPSPEADG